MCPEDWSGPIDVREVFERGLKSLRMQGMYDKNGGDTSVFNVVIRGLAIKTTPSPVVELILEYGRPSRGKFTFVGVFILRVHVSFCLFLVAKSHRIALIVG